MAEISFLAVGDSFDHIQGTIKICQTDLTTLTTKDFIAKAREQYSNHEYYDLLLQPKLFYCSRKMTVIELNPQMTICKFHIDSPFVICNGEILLTFQLKNKIRHITADIRWNFETVARSFGLKSKTVAHYNGIVFTPETIPINVFPIGTEQCPFVIEPNSVFFEKFKLEEGSFEAVPFVESTNFHFVPKQYVANSGILSPHEDLVLYKSEAFKQEVEFLTSQLASRDVEIVDVYGYPGIGKSVTAYSVACSLLDSTNIIWVSSILDSSVFNVVLLTEKKKYSAQLPIQTLDQFLADDMQFEKPVIMFIDESSGIFQKEMFIFSVRWRLADQSNRKLSLITSLISPEKEKPFQFEFERRKVELRSWTFEEYIEASKNDHFWKGILPFLDSLHANAVEYYENCLKDNENIEQTKYEMLFSKFYYAGFCPRFMFLMSTSEVRNYLAKGIDCAAKIVEPVDLHYYCYSLWDRLVCSLADKKCFISQFVCEQLFSLSSLELLEKHINYFTNMSNQYLSGWIFEIWFFKYISEVGMKATSVSGVTPEELNFPASIVVLYDPGNPDENIIMKSHNGTKSKWLKPIKNHAYDAVYLEEVSNSDKMRFNIYFFQLTVGQKHGIKTRHVTSFFTNLSRKYPSVTFCFNVRIIFLIPKSISNSHC